MASPGFPTLRAAGTSDKREQAGDKTWPIVLWSTAISTTHLDSESARESLALLDCVRMGTLDASLMNTRSRPSFDVSMQRARLCIHPLFSRDHHFSSKWTEGSEDGRPDAPYRRCVISK